MLQKEAIEPAVGRTYVSRIFPVSKKGTTRKRMILDLSILNKFIVRPSFRMTTVNQVRGTVSLGSWMATIDLKDAYWHIPIHRRFRNYLAFSVERNTYRFKAMPFGLNIAPRIFTKIVGVMIKQLRLAGIKVFAYLDDWFIWAQSKNACLKALWLVQRVLKERGFIINIKKSHLIPTQSIEWLGHVWESVSGHLALTPAFGDKALRKLEEFLKQRTVSKRELESVLGTLNFASAVDPVGKVHNKRASSVLRKRFQVLDRDVQIPAFPELHRALQYWRDPLNYGRTVLWREPPPTLEIVTDASDFGWGYHTSLGQQNSGMWPLSLKKAHINVRELVAIYYALLEVQPNREASVRVHCDNTSAVACITNKGSTRSPPLWKWSLRILLLARKREFYLRAVHIRGVSNVLADALSRATPINTEWTLDNESFGLIQTLLPDLQVDLFATRNNNQLPLFVSPVLDSRTPLVDAFRQDWSQWERIYLFPPIAMISLVLERMTDYRGAAILVTSWSPNSHWFPILLRLADRVVRLPHPQLTQRVQNREVRTSCPHFWASHAWIFYPRCTPRSMGRMLLQP